MLQSTVPQQDLFFNPADREGWLERHHANIPAAIFNLIAEGALFVINHSGGKDSQAMYLFMRRFVPAEQLIVVHADLPEVDWPGCMEHIEATIFDTPLHICRSRRTLLQMIAERGMFPSPSKRQCTSDLKRGPIEKVIRHTGHKLIVNCMGMRAEESPKRSKLQPFKFNERNSKNGRRWFDWLPMHSWYEHEIFAFIMDCGQTPHWAYAAGMSRLSCCFCIMASKEDLITAARLMPALYARYVALERSTGHVMMMPGKDGIKKTLVDITGVNPDAPSTFPHPTPPQPSRKVLWIQQEEKTDYAFC